MVDNETFYRKNNPYGYYNSTDFDINDYTTLSDILGFSYYNSTDFDIADYYLKSNPYGYYNSTNPQTETDPHWSGNETNVAFTNTIETFAEEITFSKNITASDCIVFASGGSICSA